MSGSLAQSPVSWAVLAYLVAAIPMGLALGKLRGVDLRGVGSGNIGATNAVRALGRKFGIVVFALDVLKAAAPVWAASSPQALGGRIDAPQVIVWVAMAAFCGHVYPVYLKFKGGKGVACALGVFMVLQPIAAVAGLLLYLQTLILVRVSGVASLTAATAMLVFVLANSTDWPMRVLIVVMNGIIWWRHRENLRELFEKHRVEKTRKQAEEQDSGRE